MRPVITPSEASALDQASQVPLETLMDRAGRAVALAAVGMGANYGTRVTILAGPGNNGGDGYVAARLLRQRGVGVEVLSLADPKTTVAFAAMGKARAAGVRISPLDSVHPTDLVIDALFGGGFRAGLPEAVESWIAAGYPVLSVDIPSGLDSGTGLVEGAAFHASRTVTFHALKVGHVIGSGPDLCGQIVVSDIGLVGGRPELMLVEEVDAPRPTRPRTAHKWSAGSVLVVGGAPGMVGAAVLAGKAALEFGAGAVGLAVPEDAAQIAAAAAPELLHYSIDSLPERFEVLVIGPGLGLDRAALVTRLLSEWKGPVVIDADALAAIPPDQALQNGRAVLTPHGGEFERLTGSAPSYAAAVERASALEATVLLKGNPTFVTDGSTPWVIDSGGPELATIGTGDVLAGMIAGLLATGLEPDVAARSGAYWHGRAGASLAQSRTVTATRLIEAIGQIR